MIAPILVGLGVVELDAIRVAAIANNAPVSFGALGAPIIALSTVTKLPLDQLSASIGRIVAIVALLPPWILIVLVTGRRGLRGARPLAVVGSLSYILGQFPTSQWLGPYLPDIIGAVVSFGCILLLRYLAAEGNPRLRRRADPCGRQRGHSPRGHRGNQGGHARIGAIPHPDRGCRRRGWALVAPERVQLRQARGGRGQFAVR